MSSQPKSRCSWSEHSELYQCYHDQEWGKPIFEDNKLFEFLILEGAQAGLSWITILKKRENYRLAFDGFDPAKVATYNQEKIEQLLANPGIVRNKLKIQSAITNAQNFLEVQKCHGSFSNYLWAFVDEQPIQNCWKSLSEVPARTPLSDHLSSQLKQQGFKFIGTTICYAYMQAIGMVNDHLLDCFRYHEVQAAKR